jgi:DNA-binding transcriptional LysR family regulator
MELRHLRTFLAVADGLSFTRAAEALGYAQSSVTAQIQALEAELGTRLFERLGKRVVLTEAGHRLTAYAARLVQLEAELRVAVPGASEPEGTLHIGAPESLCAYRLPPLLSAFRERHPRVRIVFQPDSCMDLRRGVAEGSLDTAFFLDVLPQGDGVIVETLAYEPLRIVTHPDHPLARAARVVPADLADETILHTERSCAYRQMFDRALLEADVRPEVAIEFASVEAIKQCAVARMGIAVLPEMAVAADVAQGRLAALRWHDPGFEVPIQLARHKDKWLSPALEAFVAVVHEAFGAKAAVPA